MPKICIIFISRQINFFFRPNSVAVNFLSVQKLLKNSNVDVSLWSIKAMASYNVRLVCGTFHSAKVSLFFFILRSSSAESTQAVEQWGQNFFKIQKNRQKNSPKKISSKNLSKILAKKRQKEFVKNLVKNIVKKIVKLN